MAKQNTALAAYKAGIRAKAKGKHHKKKFTLPIAVVAGLIPMAMRLKAHSNEGINGITKEAGRIMLGYDWYDGTFNPGWTRYGLLPILGGILVHKAASWFGVNRAIARTGIPIIRI